MVAVGSRGVNDSRERERQEGDRAREIYRKTEMERRVIKIPKSERTPHESENKKVSSIHGCAGTGIAGGGLAEPVHSRKKTIAERRKRTGQATS
jgi:hypothetical protein